MRAQKPSLDDITGNRSDHPDLKTRFASGPTRYGSLDGLAGDGVGNPFGDSCDFDFAPEEDYAYTSQDEASFFGSQQDLEYEIPSTRGQRFTAK